KIETKKKIIVGVNQFTVEKEEPVPPFKIDDSIRLTQIEKLKALKAKRDNAKINQCLESIAIAATGQTNLMPLVIEAVENYCTLGEIADA
ncbi:methylmalonyl-CoA mutase family protein, partial [Acinetobacter baumannii]